MAIARGAGTEIVRSAHFQLGGNEAVGPHTLIQGVQHHIYTVLSVICYCAYTAVSNANDEMMVSIVGYDSANGATTETMTIFTTVEAGMRGRDTYIWNDKFSFNGCEPTDFTAGLDATKQDAIADQGNSAKTQKLVALKGHANDVWDLHVTYIDQNNA